MSRLPGIFLLNILKIQSRGRRNRRVRNRRSIKPSRLYRFVGRESSKVVTHFQEADGRVTRFGHTYNKGCSQLPITNR
jgi:hypothetical protein